MPASGRLFPVTLPCLSKGPRPWISRLKRSFASIRWTLSRYLWPQPPAIEARLADPGLDPLRPHVAPVLGSSMHTRCFRNRAPRSRGGSTSDGWTAAALLSPTPHTDTVPSATLPSMGFSDLTHFGPLVQKAFRHASARISRRAATAGALGAISPAGPRRALSYWASMAT